MKGVAAYLKEEKNGEYLLVLNDIEATSNKENPDWKHDMHFTSNNYEANNLKSMSLSKEQFAEIGENLIMRLLAMSDFAK